MRHSLLPLPSGEGRGEGIERPMNSLARTLRKNSTDAERCWSIARSATRVGQVSTSTGPWTLRRGFPLLGAQSCHRGRWWPACRAGLERLATTEYLKVLGYRVIRFWNHEMLGDPDAVLESIRAALVEIPSPPPSPGGRGSLVGWRPRRNRFVSVAGRIRVGARTSRGIFACVMAGAAIH